MKIETRRRVANGLVIGLQITAFGSRGASAIGEFADAVVGLDEFVASEPVVAKTQPQASVKIQLAGTDPLGGDPTAGDPTGGDPTGGDPTGGDPTGGDPTGGDPTGGDQDPTGGDPTGSDQDPTGGDPTGGDPTGGDDGRDPTGGDPTGGDDDGRDPSGGDPTGGDPTGGDPTGGDPTGGDQDPTGGDPTGGDPTGGDPTGGDPTGGDQDPTGGDPTGGDPGDQDPTGGDPTGGDPTGGDDGRDPTGGDPTGGDDDGRDPSGGDPTGGDPTGGDPTGGDPTGSDQDPTGGDPTGGDPTGGDPSGGDPTGGDPSGGRENQECPADGTADLLVAGPSMLSTTEAGSESVLEVSLTSAPDGPMSYVIRSSRPDEASPRSGVVHFSPEYCGPRTISVVGQDDGVVDGPVEYRIDFVDQNSNTLLSVPGINLDDDALDGVIVSVGGPHTLMLNETGTYMVRIVNSGLGDLSGHDLLVSATPGLALKGFACTLLSGDRCDFANELGNDLLQLSGVSIARNDTLLLSVDAAIAPEIATTGQVELTAKLVSPADDSQNRHETQIAIFRGSFER